MTRAEMEARGWDAVDVVFVTGDAYIDHYSFAMSILGRVLEDAGFRVALLSQPDWRSAAPWRTFGKPRLFFAVSAGNMDSMINHYTAGRKVRNDDAYSPGGRIGLRPDRATIPYCQRAREAYPGVPVVAGGVEASLRRLAHYDYWSDAVRPSILLDSKADLVGYGMGEETLVEVARRLAAGKTVKDCRDLRGVAYFLGASEPVPSGPDVAELPPFEDVKASKDAFLKAARLSHHETSPFNARTLVQRHGARAVVVTPPCLPVSKERMDYYYGLPYTRRAHPGYAEPVPAFEMIKDSVTIMRGCFGGCTFCSITAHQGRTIQSRSQAGVLKELAAMGRDPDFKGTVSDIGGPTANMYEMRCTKPEVEKICRRLSCVSPTICKFLGTDHAPLVDLMKKSRAIPGVKKALVASGIRMDLARLSPDYMRELTNHHVGGRLKVAPEHTDPKVLALMKKPKHDTFEDFAAKFEAENKKAGKNQFLVPYFIASHPGSDLGSMIELAVFLKRNGYKPDQVQDFIPTPHDLATAMYYTGRDPQTGAEVPVAKGLKDRRLQRVLLQFFKPENWFEVREALLKAGRKDLIGEGCDALIPARAPMAALLSRRSKANKDLKEDWTDAPPNTAPKKGYRPARGTWGRREKKP
ncbi:MAG: radical SAM domain-containing protein [Elusimicrobia bacterium]|nr:MAG: radical SAM domain-containing protein [Elusimicrobiota bacterium]